MGHKSNFEVNDKHRLRIKRVRLKRDYCNYYDNSLSDIRKAFNILFKGQRLNKCEAIIRDAINKKGKWIKNVLVVDENEKWAFDLLSKYIDWPSLFIKDIHHIIPHCHFPYWDEMTNEEKRIRSENMNHPDNLIEVPILIHRSFNKLFGGDKKIGEIIAWFKKQSKRSLKGFLSDKYQLVHWLIVFGDIELKKKNIPVIIQILKIDWIKKEES